MTKVLSLLDTTGDERSPMSEEESRIFIHCSFGESYAVRSGKELVFNQEWADKLKESGQVLYARLMGTPITWPVAIMVCVLSKGSPGHIVLWCWTLFQIHKQAKTRITMDVLVSHFPWGFPTEEGYSRIWQAQKNVDAPLGNLLDLQTTWES